MIQGVQFGSQLRAFPCRFQITPACGIVPAHIAGVQKRNRLDRASANGVLFPCLSSKRRHETRLHDLNLLAQKGATLFLELSPGIHPPDGLTGLEADKHVGKEAVSFIDFVRFEVFGRFEIASEVVPGGAKTSIGPAIPPKRMCARKFVDRAPVVAENHDWRSWEILGRWSMWVIFPPQPDACGEEGCAVHKSLCPYPNSFGLDLYGAGAIRGYGGFHFPKQPVYNNFGLFWLLFHRLVPHSKRSLHYRPGSTIDRPINLGPPILRLFLAKVGA